MMAETVPRFEILPGLPPYGPSAFPFPTNGRGSHHEGFVVRFFPRQGESWVGNFQGGLTHFSNVELHPDGSRLIVIAEGAGYIIEPECRGTAEEFGGWYTSTLAAGGLLLLVTPIDIEGFAAAGRRWRTRRISWDGVRAIHLSPDGRTIHGEALTLDDSWVPFEVDIQSGEARGGSNNGP